MAELVSAIVPTLLKKACDSILTELAFMRGIDGRRKRLCGLLSAINDVISDAEEQAPKKPSVKGWITRLKSAALDADNVIDELHYEVLHREALRRGHDVNTGVRAFFSLNYNPLLFKYKVGKKLQEVVERIDDLVNQMNQFGFSRDRPAPVVDSRQTHSYVNEDEVIGRKGDGEEIVRMLLSSESEKFSVVAVVGIGGMGKTTLAQLVFNDLRVRAQFEVCVWVCVSDPFIVADVAKKIIDSAIGRDCGSKTDNMELLQQRLRNELGGKRYFLVVDDVWNQEVEKWDALRTLLCCGGMGSVVLVTTRQMKVASIMGAFDVHCLQHLSPEDAWTLFKRRAFSLGVVESPDLAEVGKDIVKKCCGVPLAVKSISSLMSRKQEVREWLALLDSKTWDVFNEENQIMPALRLSYYHLPSHMKQCFAFCAVFPKDYEMSKKDLIHLWIANGFILSEGALDLETIGNNIFSELVWRSFFQDVKHTRSPDRNGIGFHDSFSNGNGYSDVTTCKTHDLLHDLAQNIGHGEYFSLQKLTEINELPENVLHLHYSVYFTWPKIKVVMQNNRNIRSIFATDTYNLSVPDIYFPTSLRVFGTCITGRLSTERLPEGMKYMISLRHLYLDGCNSLACMPADIGHLSYLRTLTRYVVGNDPGCGIKELKHLELGGKLQIYDLIKVTNQSDAKEANLESKQNLEQLTLCWGASESTYQQEFPTEDSRLYPSEEILDALKPHICLQVLTVDGYMGTRFPSFPVLKFSS
nr:putative disease resistance protein RGA3 [Lolium perenne]